MASLASHQSSPSGLRSANMGAKVGQDGPLWSQVGAAGAEVRQDESYKVGQDGPKMEPRWGQHEPKRGPRWGKLLPLGSRSAKIGARVGQDGAFWGQVGAAGAEVRRDGS